MRAIKKLIEIEFYPCEEQYYKDIFNWSTIKRPIYRLIDKNIDIKHRKTLWLEIHTLEWIHKATEKDVIIKWINWEVYPCKKEIFEKTYDIVN